MAVGKSTVLFLTICSNSKTKLGEVASYEATGGIVNSISPRAAKVLLDTRATQRNFIMKSPEASRDGRLLRHLPFNEDLQVGPDFGATGIDTGGHYLPAARRYSGRFFSELGPDGPLLLMEGDHHVLITSALYGLVTPAEPIQRYSCHVTDHETIVPRWTKGDSLTTVLIDYIKRHQIGRIFELMAVPEYRQLINWSRLVEETKVDVLHCFSKEFTDDAILRPLGALAQRLLLEPEAVLLRYKAGRTFEALEDTIFLSSRLADIEAQSAMHRLSRNDQLGRMRRNMIKLLNRLLGSNDEREGFRDRVCRLGKSGPRDRKDADSRIGDMVEFMLRFNPKRNGVEYRGQILTSAEWDDIYRGYRELEEWVLRKRYLRGSDLEHIESL